MIREEIGRIAASGMGPVLLLAALAAEAYAQTAGVVVLDSDIADGFYTRSPPFSASTAWLGLYLGGEEPRIRPVEIDWSSTERDDYTEHRMSTDPEGPRLLFGDVAELSAGPAETVRHREGSLTMSEPVAELELLLGDGRYIVRRTGSDPMGCDSRVVLTDGSVTQELYTPDPNDCGEAHFAVHWAGDLDRDGRLDLVATFSPKYSRHPRQLFLSSAAQPGNLVAEVAVYDQTAM
jgi:hypothetical protein